MKHKISLSLICLFLFPFFSIGQSSSISIEYAPNFSNTTHLADSNTVFKISHELSVKYDYPISSNWSLIARLGFRNTGYAWKRTNANIISNKRALTHNINLFFTSIGNTFRFKQYFVSPEIGMGFQQSSSLKTVSTNSQGVKTARRSRSKPDNLRWSTIPLSISIGREVELFSVTYLVGLKGHYSFFKRSDTLTTNGEGIYGIGLMLGLKLH